MPPKRKSAPAEEAEAPRRSTRQRTSAAHEPAPPPPKKPAKAPAKAKAAVSKKKADEQQEKPSKGVGLQLCQTLRSVTDSAAEDREGIRAQEGSQSFE